MPLLGSYERGKVPLPLGAPSPAGKSAGTERELQRLREEHSSWHAAGRKERDQHRESMPLPCAPQLETQVCWCARQLGAKTSASEDRPEERTGVGCAETA